MAHSSLAWHPAFPTHHTEPCNAVNRMSEVDENCSNIDPLAINLKGYTQTYLLKSTGGENDTCASREAFFRCGNWCYTGSLDVSYQNAFEMTLRDIPQIIPSLQQQQGKLSYFCKASEIPASSSFHGPLNSFDDARDIVVRELSSDEMILKINQLKKKHSWIEHDQVYFELVGSVSHLFEDILFICSKVYSFANGLIFNMIYFEGAIYVTIQDLQGDQPLIDVNFPDISVGGRDVVVSLYDNADMPWMKLSIRQVQVKPYESNSMINPPKKMDISSDCYIQSYCILKSDCDNRDVMFRWGSWCYSGRVELAPTLELEDLPSLIPLLRLQQSKLKFVSDVSSVKTSPYGYVLEYVSIVTSIMEKEAQSAEDFLANVIERASIDNTMKSSKELLEGDGTNWVFEFSCINNPLLDEVDIIATKKYRPSGLISSSIYHNRSFFLILTDGSGSEHPLLDSKFPDLSVRFDEYSINSYPSGLTGFPQLRKMTLFRTNKGDEASFECDSVESSTADFNNRNDLDETILSKCSLAESSSSEEEEQPLKAAIDIIEDAMLDICDTFDEVMIDINNGYHTQDKTERKEPGLSKTDRAKRLSILEKKLNEMRRLADQTETERRVWDENGRPVLNIKDKD